MRTTVEWKQGESGSGSTYTFNPKPVITRPYPAQKLAVLEIPLLAGSVVQELGSNTRKIDIQGIIYVDPPNFDNLFDAKVALETGIGNSVGQLHIISHFGQGNSRHIYYKGILDGDIQWSEQRNMTYLEYRFSILCADPTEYGYSGYSGYSGY